MPQMAPLPWFFLFVLVLFSMFIYISVVYTLSPKAQWEESQFMIGSLSGTNWKW